MNYIIVFIISFIIIVSCDNDIKTTNQTYSPKNVFETKSKTDTSLSSQSNLKEDSVVAPNTQKCHHVVYGRIKLTCYKMGKPYDEGEIAIIAKSKDRLENKYASYKIQFYKKGKKIGEVFTDKSKRFKYSIELPCNTYCHIRLYLKTKEDKEYKRIEIDKNDDVNTNKEETKRHIWVSYGGC